MNMEVNAVNKATNLDWKIHPPVYWEFQSSWRKTSAQQSHEQQVHITLKRNNLVLSRGHRGRSIHFSKTPHIMGTCAYILFYPITLLASLKQEGDI